MPIGDIYRQVRIAIDIVTRGAKDVETLTKQLGEVAGLTKHQAKAATAAGHQLTKMYSALKNVAIGEESVNIIQKEHGRTMETIREKWVGVSHIAKGQIKALEKQGIAFKDVTHYVKKNGKELKNFYNGQMLVSRGVTTLTRAHERFKMHLLSVMFFGMAITRFLSKYNDLAWKSTGITDFFSAVMQISTIRAMEPYRKSLLDLGKAMLDFDDAHPGVIGSVSLLTEVIGKALMYVGMLGLGYQGLKVLLTDLLPPLTAFLASINPLSLQLALVTIGILAFLAAIDYIIKAAEDAWTALNDLATAARWTDSDFGFFKDTLILACQTIQNLYDIIDKLLKLDFEGVMKAWNRQISDVVDYLERLTGMDLEGLKDTIQSIVGKTTKGYSSLFESSFGALKKMFGFQYGGVVPGPIGRPVPVIAHGGERFLGAGNNASELMYSPTYNITAIASSGRDLDTMISDIESRDIRKMKRRLLR